jgi:hypothetical protein
MALYPQAKGRRSPSVEYIPQPYGGTSGDRATLRN